MRRLLAVCAFLLLMLLSAAPVHFVLAQASATPTRTSPPTVIGSSCGAPFNPCGALPWRPIIFSTAVFPSPTQGWPTYTATPPYTATLEPTMCSGECATAGPSPTPTATPTATYIMDIDSARTLSQQIGDISSTLSAQTTAEVHIDGTPVSLTDLTENFSRNAVAPFGILAAIKAAFDELGLIGALLNFMFWSFMFSLLVNLSTMIVPTIISLVRFILQVIMALKPF